MRLLANGATQDKEQDMNIATATPAEIDTELAKLHGRRTTIRTQEIDFRRKAQARYTSEASAAMYLERAEALRAQANEIAAEMLPLEEEYVARGRWTRAFVVADGHVHSSLYCSTCNNGTYPTMFGWVTEFSGKTEAEVIEAAGSRACTVCYPNAPVDAPAGRIFHADEIAAEEARQERAAKKAAADAKKAANAFGPYKTAGRFGDKLETLFQARKFLTDGASWGWDHPSYSTTDRDAVAEMLAAKLGTTTQVELEAAAKRAANR